MLTLFLLIISILTLDVLSFIRNYSNNYCSSISTVKFGNNENNWYGSMNEDYDSEDDGSNQNQNSIRKNAFLWNIRGPNTYTEDKTNEKELENLIVPLVENMITRMAINTTAYYCDMIGDQATMRWLKSVKDFDIDGLNTISWTEYIDELTRCDPFDVKIRMPATKNALHQLIGGNEKLSNQLKGIRDVSRIRIESTQRIEPRKICSQILKDRKCIAAEVIADLQSIRDENLEAMRFAKEWLAEGDKQVVEKTRKICREDSEESSSPFRAENFVEVSILVTNIVIDLLRTDLAKEEEEIEFLNTFVQDFEFEWIEDSSFFPMTARVIDDEKKVSRSLVETLYYRGLKDGSVIVNGKPVNILRLANMLMEKRVNVARIMVQILQNMVSNIDPIILATIKNRGGYKKFDLDAKPNFKIIDLDNE